MKIKIFKGTPLFKMILTYTKDTEDVVFAISYLTLPIEFVPGSEFSLKVQEEEYFGVQRVFNELIELCKCDPHDLSLLNEDVVKEIMRIRHSLPSRELRKLLLKKPDEMKEDEPSNTPLNNYLIDERLTMADIVLFAMVYKSIKEGAKYTVVEKNWFDQLQKHLSNTMEFKELEMIDFEMMDIRIGKITEIRKHPKADKLFIEQVDIGQPQKLQILSGLVGHYKLEELKDQYCLFMISLKKQKFQGEISQGMILCAATKTEFEVLKAPIEITGEKLYLEGSKRPVIRTFNVPKLDGKKDEFADIFKYLTVKDNKLQFMDKTVLVGGKPIITTRIKDGDVR
ncbi:methionine-tRNA synthetase, beta subunit [Pseudoloma neurophilia]|uniref:Methionine-tRNA synthetase, beta subunit n=1 Tax=Pseudoloma neurophilia TaxID=146866 RepID=A0A0R0M4B5_9MICR|nr:methionine-tRNA synthetase, beta subunit [Pseudoloma neurophilia]